MAGGIKVKTAFPGTTYQGLSTGEKPWPKTTASLVTFLETDTGRLFYWTGTTWVEGSPEVQELREIRSLLGAILEQLTPGL